MIENGQRYKLLVEILSAIAVVLTLVFVGLELRETARQTALNTESVQVAAYQDLIAQISQFNRLLLDPTIASVFERMMNPKGDWAEFSAVERRQARSLLFLLVRHADMAFYQYQRGLLPKDRLNSALLPLLSDIDKPMYRAFWEEIKGSQVPSFREYIDKRIAEATH